MALLNTENYTKGFLIDEELMGGVSSQKEKPGQYIAFVLRFTTGEYLGYREFSELEPALDAINAVMRTWKYEKSSGCGSCADGACGKDKGQGCSKIRLKNSATDRNSPPCSDGACPV